MEGTWRYSHMKVICHQQAYPKRMAKGGSLIEGNNEQRNLGISGRGKKHGK